MWLDILRRRWFGTSESPRARRVPWRRARRCGAPWLEPREDRTVPTPTLPVANGDVATLNRYFREYYLAHGQGGTHTLQRNLIQLFNYLEHERGFAIPSATASSRKSGPRSARG